MRSGEAPRGEPTFLTAARRDADLEALAGGLEVDVLVVGGGVTGAGAALDAATRGLSVALVERGDLAMGTSRFSSKLAHGGLRYLTKLQFGIAWESARERARLSNAIAPHLIRALPQLTPVYGDHPPPLTVLLEIGIRIGDAMRALSGTSRRRLPPMRRVSAAEALLWAPGLRAERLRGAILAWDGQLEDDARLVVALARTAAAHGARVLTYCEALELTGDGARVRDARSDTTFDLRARAVINATGVWADRLVDDVHVRASRGSHLLVPAASVATPRAMINLAVPGSFGRFVFAVPRSDGLVMIGLTDDLHVGADLDAPAVTVEDERFLLETVSTALQRPLTADDVVGRFAGLRPLLEGSAGATADLSRKHAVLEDRRSGAVTVVGGKLTTYRQMAEDAVDMVAARPGVGAGPCRTTQLPLVGATPAPYPSAPARLLRRFGAEAGEIAALAGDRPELLEPVAEGVPILGVELLAAVQREGALTLDDVLDRRTRSGFVADWREAVAEAADRLIPTLVPG